MVDIDCVNDEQERAFKRIIKDAETSNKSNPLVLFVCGQAGTGKSWLIRKIVNYIGDAHVIVAATTGFAAKNIGGRTIHKALQLNASNSNCDANDTVIVSKFLKLVIIDEISMCNAVLFERAEARIRRIMGNPDVLFGGCTVVLFGDLLQLPPVAGSWVFKSKLWQNHVQYVELEQNMRQQEDPVFAERLQRWRLGFCTASDERFLNELASLLPNTKWDSCVNNYLEHYDEEKNMMMLAWSNSATRKLNRMVTHKLFKQEDLYDVVHQTIMTTGTSTKTNRNVSFQVAKKSRVMIEKNIDSQLVNGQIATVNKIFCNDYQATQLELILHENKSVRILERIDSWPSTTPSTKTHVVGLPIAPAYALTYHKSQGQTLDKVFLLAYPCIPPGMFYVGVSRVRKSEDLHIMNWNACLAIKADPEAKAEYKRLRISIGKSPLPIFF
ncbi:hypothetical protein CRE_25901 [Caenorhabditis remanei]|uniref:ATP-dependent DNA helicase n=1 Tax=Caenorhabditis remanei TaxID=31234 RepID=E3NGE1_CAERE|nr:hypothetical protein CRE_25901 [Caenorhabditis remanei]